MSFSGTFTRDFTKPISFSQSLKEVYDILFITWKMVKVNADIPTGNLENDITCIFYSKIRTKKAELTENGERQYCFSFLLNSSEVNDNGKLIATTDIQVQFGNDERQRFTLEAKLLNKPKDNNIGAYVGYDGMGRFIRDGKYGIGVSAGGMIGYVLDGDAEKARNNVADSIMNKRKSLGMCSTGILEESGLRESVYMTSHNRKQAPQQFTIYHVFLSVQNGN
jgi:hypothetical protein